MNPRFPDISSPYPRHTSSILSRHHVRQSGRGVRSVNVTLYIESGIQSRNVSSDNSTSVNSPFL